MKFALLGGDPAVLELAAAVANSPDHELVWAHLPRAQWPALAAFAPHLRPSEEWEGLLAGVADAVLAGPGLETDADERADQVRRLVADRIPVLAVHPFHPASLIYYELESQRGEPPAVLVPYLPSRGHPAVTELASWLAASRARGETFEQLVCERFLADRNAVTIRKQFAVDVDLAASLAGEFTHLGALAPGATAFEAAPQYANLGVQAFGKHGTMFRWSVSPVDPHPGARWTLVTSGGKATLEALAGQPWKVERRTPEGLETREFPTWTGAAETLAHFVAAIEHPSATPTLPDWDAALRAAELAEAIDRSLTKRRTIEVRGENLSEAGAFKTTMSAASCVLLAAAPVVICSGAILSRTPMLAWLGWAILGLSVAVMVVFLLLQTLGWLASKEPRR